MNCGTAYCEQGCPIGSDISEWVGLVKQGRPREAYESLRSDIIFPEFTSRLCVAPCEACCCFSIREPSVSICDLEDYIIELAFRSGWVKPNIPAVRRNKKVAIIGSGPAGLAAADNLNALGYTVIIFEREVKAGGALRYVIPDARLEKWVLDRRLSLMEEAGVQFRLNCHVGYNMDVNDLLRDFGAVVLCIGSANPRNLLIPGREVGGVYFLKDVLRYCNAITSGDIYSGPEMLVTGKDIIVFSDHPDGWVGVLARFGARSVTVLSLLPRKPYKYLPEHPLILPELRPFFVDTQPFMKEPLVEMLWSIAAKELIADEVGNLRAVKLVRLEWSGKDRFIEVEGSEVEFPCDMAILAMGFVGPEHEGLLRKLDIDLDDRGNIATNSSFGTSIPKVFAAGDGHIGQSHVPWAIAEGNKVAKAVHLFLSGPSY